MEILGHSQISITMDVYTHVVQDTQREAMSHVDRLLQEEAARSCGTTDILTVRSRCQRPRTMIGPGPLPWCPRQDSNLRHPL